MTSETTVHRFIVTIWSESGGATDIVEWRGNIRDVNDGKIVYFRNLHGINAAWQGIMQLIEDQNNDK